MKQYLTIAESDELVAMGVSPETASHIYSKTEKCRHMICAVRPILQSIPGRNIDYERPCFSVSDILAILPENINGCGLKILRVQTGWQVSYGNPYDSPNVYPPIIKAVELIDALSAILKWCISRKNCIFDYFSL